MIFELRYSEGNIERAPELTAELVRLNVDVIVASAPPMVRAVQRATSSIPIVMTAVSEPVGNGVRGEPGTTRRQHHRGDERHPGRVHGETLQLIKEAIPSAARIGLLFNAANPLNYATAFAQELAVSAPALKLQLHHLEIRSAEDIQKALTAANFDKVDAVLVVGDPLIFQHRKRIHELAARHKLPTFVPTPEYADDQALLAYGPSLRDALRQTARYVHKILKGAKPAELPVEQPREYRVVVNLRVAKALGLTIPPSLVIRANEVIE